MSVYAYINVSVVVSAAHDFLTRRSEQDGVFELSRV